MTINESTQHSIWMDTQKAIKYLSRNHCTYIGFNDTDDGVTYVIGYLVADWTDSMKTHVKRRYPYADIKWATHEDVEIEWQIREEAWANQNR